ncbi:MAG: C-type lectin domain-containing protein [Polyangiaceae bacterium]|nr:C-type lectin domain-containing protein [Polyangiaceae bacterium]
MGGYLASIGSVEEDTLITQHIAGGAWIGGWQGGLDSLVIWEAPAPWCQLLWDGGEPNSNNEDCLELRTNGKWNDATCDSTRAYVCEIPP